MQWHPYHCQNWTKLKKDHTESSSFQMKTIIKIPTKSTQSKGNKYKKNSRIKNLVKKEVICGKFSQYHV